MHSYLFHSWLHYIQIYKYTDMNSLYQHIVHHYDMVFLHNRQCLVEWNIKCINHYQIYHSFVLFVGRPMGKTKLEKGCMGNILYFSSQLLFVYN